MHNILFNSVVINKTFYLACVAFRNIISLIMPFIDNDFIAYLNTNYVYYFIIH